MMSTGGDYPTAVNDAQWEALLLPPPKWRPGGPGRKPMDLRRVIDGPTFGGRKSPCMQLLMGTPWRLHGLALCWPVTAKASPFLDNCNPSALGVGVYPTFRASDELTKWG